MPTDSRILWQLDRETGAFINATDFGYQHIVDIDPEDPETGGMSFRPGMMPVLDERLEFCPSHSGLKSRRAMAYHPETEAFYIPPSWGRSTAGPTGRP